ncbi:AI-2E family transporter, partial [bacterium]|nr:AI-2E family transporter [bacterium]
MQPERSFYFRKLLKISTYCIILLRYNLTYKRIDKQKKPIYVNITVLGVVKVVLVFVIFYFLFLVRDILAILFISLIVASAFGPWVDWMQRKKIPRALGILLIYLAMFAFIGMVIYLIIPPIIEQATELANSFPGIAEKIISGFSILREYSIEQGVLDNIKENFGSLSANIQNIASGVFSTVTGIFGGIFTFFIILVITFYMVVEEQALKKIVWSVTPARYQLYVMRLVNRMQKKVGLWLRGQLILSLIIFSLTYVGLLVLGVKYALILALIAGLTEFVPYLGPILASIPAIFLAFTQAPMLAAFVAILYYIIQLVENNIIVPKLMQKVVGLNPIVSIAVLMIGFKIGG